MTGRRRWSSSVVEGRKEYVSNESMTEGGTEPSKASAVVAGSGSSYALANCWLFWMAEKDRVWSSGGKELYISVAMYCGLVSSLQFRQ